MSCVRKRQTPLTLGGRHCGPLWNGGGKAWETTSATPGKAELIEVTASAKPSLGRKVAKVGPRRKNKWQVCLFGRIQGQNK